MINKMQCLKVTFSFVLVCSLFLNSVPVQAQDIVSSDDISSGGSSVFVFRKSRKAPQTKNATRTTTTKRNKSEKAESRKKVKQEVAKVTPKRKKVEVEAKPTPTPKGQKPDVMASRIKASNEIGRAAELHLDKGDLPKAVSFFRQSIQLNPKNELAKLGLSEALTLQADDMFEKESEAEAAIPLYQEAITLDGNNAAAYAGLGGIYEELDDTENTFINYNKALSLNPNLTELYAPLGIANYQKGEIAKADELLTKAVAIRANDYQTQYLLGLIRYKQQNRDDEAVAALKRSLELKVTAEAYYYLGEVYDRQDKEKEAIAEYNKAIKENPNYVEAWFDLGAAYYNRSRFEDSINAYNQVIKLKNSNYEAHENLADVYRQLAANSNDPIVKKQNYQKAEGLYKIATDLIKNNPKIKVEKLALAELYSKYGFILGRMEKWDSAAAALNQAVALNPDSVDYTNLGWAYYNGAQKDLFAKKEAEKVSDTTLAQQKETDAKLKLEQSRNTLQKADALNPNFVGTLLNLGVTLSDLGDYQGSVDALRKCVAQRPDWFPALNELGIAYRGAGNLVEAANTFRKASDEVEKLFKGAKTDFDKQLYGNSLSSGLYNLATTESLRGNDKGARDAQARLKKINPNMAEALNLVFANPKNQLKQKIEQKNPLNRIPRPY